MDFRYYESPRERELRVLDSVIRLHTERAEPVSSAAVSRDLGHCWSSATIRNVFTELEELGWLVQPHRAAGRIPTDLGYRIYVERVIRPGGPVDPWRTQLEAELGRQDETLPALLDRAARLISRLSHALGISLLVVATPSGREEGGGRRALQITGVEELLGQPEFEDPGRLRVLVHLLDDSTPVGDYLRALSDAPGRVRVRIGSENTLNGLDQFSLIGARISRAEESAIMGLLGPVRMEYPLVLASMESLVRLLHEGDDEDPGTSPAWS
ncbi:MAG: hypothetical protein R3C71_12410 [Candidatus Krumholzibacteriia bacterium]|nr:hypothetical protein [bacterium]MCB9512812.1 hypothetical protein [Candidatus Latescibacterota bacterium]MCB9516897.1 hypothetical protein [Candidatus Latescibacterota bacterium]